MAIAEIGFKAGIFPIVKTTNIFISTTRKIRMPKQNASTGYVEILLAVVLCYGEGLVTAGAIWILKLISAMVMALTGPYGIKT